MTEHPLHPSKLAPKLRNISENEHVPGSSNMYGTLLTCAMVGFQF